MGPEPGGKGRPWRFDRLVLAGIHDLDAVDHPGVVYNARLGSERIAAGDWNASSLMTAREHGVKSMAKRRRDRVTWCVIAGGRQRRPNGGNRTDSGCRQHRREFTPQNAILSRTCQYPGERYEGDLKRRKRDVLYSRLANAFVEQLRWAVVDSSSCVMDRDVARVERGSDATATNCLCSVACDEVETRPCRQGI